MSSQVIYSERKEGRTVCVRLRGALRRSWGQSRYFTGGPAEELTLSVGSETGNTGEERSVIVSCSTSQSPRPLPNFQVMVTCSLALPFGCRSRSLGTPGAALQPLLRNVWILRLAFLLVLPILYLPLFPPPQ